MMGALPLSRSTSSVLQLSPGSRNRASRSWKLKLQVDPLLHCAEIYHDIPATTATPDSAFTAYVMSVFLSSPLAAQAPASPWATRRTGSGSPQGSPWAPQGTWRRHAPGPQGASSSGGKHRIPRRPRIAGATSRQEPPRGEPPIILIISSAGRAAGGPHHCQRRVLG